MSKYTVKYDAGEIQDNLDGVIDKPALALSNTSTNSKGEVTTSSVQFTFSEPTVDGESATLIKNNLKLANLNRGAIVLDQDTTESSIDIEDELESSTNYQATLTQYADEQIEAYSEVKFKTAQDAPFDISTDTITLRQGDSTEISFTNDGCSLSVNSEYSLVNITQNTNSIGLTAVTNDMGSDHLTITATKDGFFTKTFSITVIVPDVTIECSPLAISIDGDVDEYKDVVVTTNGDSISFSVNNDNCSVELLSTSQDGLTATYRVTGESDGGSIITFNALVDNQVVETCTCGVTLSNMYTPQIAFTASKNGSNINFFGASSGYNTSDFDVYINGVKTSQVFNSLTFSADDKIQIKANKNVRFYPYFTSYVERSLGTNSYTKSIDCIFPTMSMNANSANPEINFVYCFVDCTSLTSIPKNLFKNNTEATDFQGCFAGCISLTSIPQDLFKNNTEATNFNSCFNGCSSLTSISENLFKYNTKVTNFRGVFAGCSSLTSIPENLFRYNLEVTDFQGCVTMCTGLTSIPQDLFKYNPEVTSFSICFQGCSSLTSIPQDLFKYNTEVTNFYQCFAGCTSLTSIPQDLFKYNTEATNLRSCFSSCSSLTSIPSDLFEYNTKVTDFYSCFYGCSSITSAVPELWISHPNVSNHSYCFWNCTNASNYADIPSGWK